MTTPTTDRLISLEIAHNVRHLGGYAAGARRTSDRLVRAASLHRLTGESIDRLRELGITTVVDFRHDVELERNPTPAAVATAMSLVRAPVFQSDASPSGLGKEFPGYATIYERFLTEGGGAYRSLAENIIEGAGGVLFHCSAGKDRTGVASALLLELAGVDDDVIVADYAETERHLEPEIPAWLESMKKRNIDEEMGRKLLASEPEAMVHTLGFLRERWGGAAGYFASLGLTNGQVEQLRAKVLA